MLRVYYTRLSTKQLDYLAEQTIVLGEMNANPAVVQNPLFELVKVKHTTYRGVVIRQTYSGKGVDLKDSDTTRDKGHTALDRIVDGFAAFPTAKQAAALVLQGYFDETGNISSLSYADESVVLEKLIEKLNSAEGQAAIATLGIADEVAMFVQYQADFNRIYIEQIDANSDLRSQKTASGMRRELEDALRNYYGIVSAMSGIDPWNDIYMDLKELLKKF